MLPIVFDGICAGSNLSFPQGYISGRLHKNPNSSSRLIQWIERVEGADVRAGLELRAVGGDKLDDFPSAITAVDQGKIPTSYLSRFGYAAPTPERVNEILGRFKKAIPLGDQNIRPNAINFLGAVYQRKTSEDDTSPIKDAEVRNLTWTILELTLDRRSSDDGYQRAEILEQLSDYDAARSSLLLLESLIVRGFGTIHDHETRALVSLATQHPRQTMESLGKFLMDSRRGMILFIGKAATSIIDPIPAPVIMDWVRRTGVEGAQKIARILPTPFVTPTGKPVVPAVTLELLNEFGGDDQVCDNVVGGSFKSDSWWGNGGDHFRSKAATSRRFLSHENRCIRRWAQIATQRNEALAESEQLRHDERMLE